MRNKIQKQDVQFHRRKILSFLGVFVAIFSLGGSQIIWAAGDTVPIPFSFDFGVRAAENGADVVNSLQILFILTLIAMAPSLFLMLTSFTRVLVVLHFTRTALGTQQAPPNQVLIGLALFITLFIMAPVGVRINDQALQPYARGEISQQVAIERGIAPVREFMLKQTNDKDLKLFMEIAEVGTVQSVDEVPITTIIPAFIISELRAAFIMGFLIYIPFIVIDMVVSSTLMSMGMMMLPPVMISMPFKLLLFIVADGWNLIIGQLVQTFYR